MRRSNRKLQPEELSELVAAYQRGETAVALAKQFGLHRQTVASHLKRAGVAMRPQLKMTGGLVAKAAELYGDGLTTAQVGQRLGADASTVGIALKRAGIKLRPQVAERWPSDSA